MQEWVDSVGQQIASVIVLIAMLFVSVRGYIAKLLPSAPAQEKVSEKTCDLDEIRQGLRDLERAQDRTTDAVIRLGDHVVAIRGSLERR